MRPGLLGSKGTTLDLLRHALHTGRLRFEHVFSIPPELAARNDVAYYEGEAIADICRAAGIPHSFTGSYDLSRDHGLLAAEGIDLLAVFGWERLLPDEVLRSLKFGAVGMHGSAFGLPRGRGRSPMNWSLIQGHNRSSPTGPAARSRR